MKTRLILIVLLLAVAVTPGLAQQDTTSTLTVGGLTFAVDPDFAPGMQIMRHTAASTETMPVEPPHTMITLYDGAETVPGILQANGSIMLYEAATMTEGDAEYTRRVETLQGLLDEQTDLTTFMRGNLPGEEIDVTLPFLPVFMAAQIIRAQAKYVELDGLSGIRYITTYRQDVGPFAADGFLLTFQGISDDGATVVTAAFPISIDLFPVEATGADFDYTAFVETYDEYLAESIETINDAGASNFTPSLDVLDGIIESFVIE